MGETMRAICRDHGTPNIATVYRWIAADAGFRERYVRARESQAHVWADEVLEVARSATDAQLGRLEVDALKWAASKGSPKYYGDKVALEHTVTEPIQVCVITGFDSDAEPHKR